MSKETITLDGRPALLARVKENKNWMNEGMPDIPDPEPTPFLQGEQLKRWQEAQDEFKRTRGQIKKDMAQQRGDESVKHTVFLVVTDRTRVITIWLEQNNAFPDDQTLRTIRDSFRFR